MTDQEEIAYPIQEDLALSIDPAYLGQPEPKPQKPRRLTRKQVAFVDAYTNPDADTFGNGVRSVLAIPKRNGESYKGASKQATDYLDNPRIQSELQAISNQAGLTYQFRFKTLSLIAQGQYVTTETITRIDKKGREHKKTITRTPKASEVIKAIDVASKLVGDYEANRARGNAMSTRFRELARLYRPKLSKAVAKRLHVDDDEEVLEVVHKSIHTEEMSICSIGPLVCIADPTINADQEQAVS